MANEDRGEFEIELAGQPLILRPSFEAIGAMEAATGKSLITLAAAAQNKELMTSECAIIVTECIKAGGKASGNIAVQGYRAEKVGPLLVEVPGGILLVQERLRVLMYMAATGALTVSGEIKAAQANTAKTTEGENASAASPARPSAGVRKTSGNRRR